MATGLPGEMRDWPPPDFVPIDCTGQQVRGVWVTRWDFRAPRDIAEIVKNAALGGLNRIYLQVRGEADAYYLSSVEPWAMALTGTLGKDPGWDPLQTALEAAHAQGIEVHAWLNAATLWRGPTPPGRSSPEHIFRKHPEWKVVHGGGAGQGPPDPYVFASVAHPDFQDHLEKVLADLVERYAVDGVHLDYIRYPGKDTSHDPKSLELYRRAREEAPGLSQADWQRQQLTAFVTRLTRRAHQLRPAVQVSAAVTGICRNRWGWLAVSEGCVDFYQDSPVWGMSRAVDALHPMIYWPPTNPPGGKTDFRTLSKEFAWLQQYVDVVPGVNVAAGDFSTLKSEIRIAREAGYCGVVLFSYSLLKERGWFDKLKEAFAPISNVEQK